MRGFTKDFGYKTNIIYTNVTIINPINNKSIIAKGVWDTGSTTSIISQNIANKLGLISEARQEIIGISGSLCANKYTIDLELPNKIIIHNLKVNDGILNSNEMLLGMDIISRGKFIITNKNGRTIFSFFMVL